MAQAEETRTYDVDAQKFYTVITQYEKYPEFVDGMKKVTLERAPGAREFVGHYELSMMGKDMSYSLLLQENPDQGELSWSLKSSEFFKVNNGKWKIESLGAGQCRATYSLEVEFTFSVPGFVLKPMIKGTLPSMMNGFAERAKKL
jgi:ribosome-associated toxin RatA of RatAB toxin-antitoxin module